MIANSSIKTAIVNKFSNLENFTDYEKIATEIIFYKYLLSFIANNPTEANNMSSLVSSYADSFVNKFIGLKNKFTSYLEIINFLKKIEANNLLSMKENDITYVYNIYCNSREIEDFSISNFSPAIYGAYNLSAKDHKYLYNIHENVMVHIIRYYMKFYGVQESDMKIVDSNAENNIGKRVEFYIEGVPASVIYADIIGNKFPFKYSKVNFKFPNIELINN